MRLSRRSLIRADIRALEFVELITESDHCHQSKIRSAPRDKARAIAKTEAYAVSCRERKKVEMLFAHLKRILRLGRLRLRGPNGAKDEFLLAATAQNLRKLAKLIPHPAPIFAT
jgi:hypothetical protein